MTQDELLTLLKSSPTSFDELSNEGKFLIASLVRPAPKLGFEGEQLRLIAEWVLIADDAALEAIATHNAASPFQVAPIYDEKSESWLIPSIVFTDARPPAETYAPLWPVLKRLKFRRVILGDLL